MLKKEMAEDKQVLESFYREARASAALNHTNIIHIYTFDEYEGSPTSSWNWPITAASTS